MPAAESKDNVRPASVAYNLFILILTLYAIFIVLLLLFANVAPSTYQTLLSIDTFICLVFFIDFGRQYLRADSKIDYMKRTGWLELLGSIPAVPLLRFARLARLISVLQELRKKPFRQMLIELRHDRAGAAFLFVSIFGLLALTLVSILVLAFERNAPGANIDSLNDALWWAIVTTATVGYGDYYPVTNPGRMLSIVLMTFGIGIFGLLASSLASWFLAAQTAEEKAADKGDFASLQQELAELRQEIQELRAALTESASTESPD